MGRRAWLVVLFLPAVVGGPLRPGRAAPGAEPPGQAAPTVQQWISLKGAAGPRISPDGRSVAYTIRSADWGADAFDDEVWVADVASGKSYQLTDAKGSSWNPSWSPDGRSIAFLSTREGRPQIYLASPPGRDAVRLTKAERGVDDFRWSPDGSSIAFTTTEVFPRPGGDEPPEYHVVGNDPASSTSLWIVAVPADGAPPPPRRVIDGADYAVDDISWSPDSRRIAFSASRYKDPHPLWTYDLRVLTVADGSVRTVLDRQVPHFFPVWSPDGKEIAFRTHVLSNKEEYRIYSAGYVAVVPAEGGMWRVLTEQFDENATPIAWSAEGIYFAARQRTYQHLFRLDPATRAIERVSQPYAAVFTSFSFTPDGRTVAFLAQDARTYDEVCVSDLKSFRPKRLTSLGDQLKGWRVGTREIIEWKSKDGTPIDGVLIKPADFDPGRRYPLVVIVHHGPVEVDQATITRDLPYPAEPFVARGAVVLRPNYRGSPGYGRKFRELLVRNEGRGPCEDIIAGVDHLVARGVVDPKRVVAAGWSAGGYLTAFLGTDTDRFRAVTVGEGTADVRLFYSVGAAAAWRLPYARATPWDDPEYYRDQSPLTYVKRARTPTLIQHREADAIAPPASTQELHRALKDQGVAVKMIVYKGAGHLPSGLKQFRYVAEHNLEWMARWLWEE
jgi:dipeptidyl aminopeptidase/acylaminoacyl peptidase